MRGINDLEATRQITDALPETRVVMLTVSEEDKKRFRSYQGRCLRVSFEKVEPEKLRELLQGVFHGEAPLSGATDARISKEFAANTSKDSEATPVGDLTMRAKEVLRRGVSIERNRRNPYFFKSPFDFG